MVAARRGSLMPIPDSPQTEHTSTHQLVEVRTSWVTWRGIRLRWCVFAFLLLPLVALVIIACTATQRTTTSIAAATTTAQEVAMWSSASTADVLRDIATAISRINSSIASWLLCNQTLLSAQQSITLLGLASLGDHELVLANDGGEQVAYVYSEGSFRVWQAAWGGRAAATCTFPAPPSTVFPLVAVAPATNSSSPVTTSIPSPLITSATACRAYPTGIACSLFERADSALFLKTAAVAKLLARLSKSTALVVVFDRISGTVISSPCGDGQPLSTLAACLFPSAGISLGADGVFLTSHAIAVVQSVTEAMDWALVVALPIDAFQVTDLNAGALVGIIILFVVTATAIVVGMEHLRGVLQETAKALQDSQSASTPQPMEVSRVIWEVRDLVEAYAQVIKSRHTQAYIATNSGTDPEAPAPSLGRGRTNSDSSASSLIFTGHVRAHRQASNSSLMDRGPTVVRCATVPPVSPPGCPDSVEPPPPPASFQATATPRGCLWATAEPDATSTDLVQRVGTVLIAELYYRNVPLSSMAGGLHAQQGIGETFMQMALNCLEETRGTVVSFDLGRVVATWNVHSSQATHEYWASKAALEIRSHFPASINALCNVFSSKSNLSKQDFQVLVALSRGPLIGGLLRSAKHSATVLHGDAIRMAERLLTLNSLCETTILMTQQTFEAVQGYVTADLVDYVLDVRKEHVTAVYHLLGTDTVDLVGFRDLYKDAVIALSTHEFPAADDILLRCQRLLEDPRATFGAFRQVQCRRLRQLILHFLKAAVTGENLRLPHPYYRRYQAAWEEFDSLSESSSIVSRLRETDDLPKCTTIDVVNIRAGMTTVTADVLTGLLSKEALNEEAWTPSNDPLGHKRGGLTSAEDCTADDSVAISLHDLENVCTVDANARRLLDRSLGSPVSTGNSIDGRSFRDIFGRLWRCSKECVGQGGFGTVYLGIDEQGKISAIKEHIFKCNSETIRQKVSVNEIVMLWNLQHKNIVSYQGCAVVGNSLAIIMEYISCGSLDSIVKSFGCISEGVAVQYTRDTVRGLAFLHENGVVHLDVKPANVLLDQFGTCKLADFGTATALSNLMDLHNGLMGTPVYMAPERVSGLTSDLSDIWSWGITLAEVLSGKAAYAADLPPEAILFGLYSGTLTPKIPDGLSVHATSFLRVCLAQQPEERAHAEELLGHPFLL
eukprot:GGOE01062314.1.p1 GENE.GGOE01062314.1~~GGOE01062314.1.p1  ORF type:complete len:1194 (-),score=383.93 GGOE01062314.1:553-4092(-)